MTLSRRTFALGATAFLSACGGGGASPISPTPARDPDLMPTPNPGFDAWVAGFRARARSRGISESTLDRAFRGAGFLPGVVARDRNQTEFKRSFEDYLNIVAGDARVATGREKFRQNSSLLSEVEARYGVPASITCAIWGVESRFGARRGDIPVISATATLAYDGRRGDFFEAQLLAALRILERGDTSAGQLTGSWAGAMGHTQFIPTTYQAHAVDFRGDGRRDIWSEDPTDGLASAAAYLADSGWRRGRPWGLEVRAPEGLPTGRGNRRTVASWTAAGVTSARGGALPALGDAALLRPSGIVGPAFLVSRNFDVILRYNNSENYALGVGYLASRIAGGPPLSAQFPPDATGLTADDRKRLQELLTSRGFDTGGTDGVIGPNTEEAIRAYQASVGLPVTGTPSPALLQALAR
ncbi:Membrane-bound lytic murein transglycosylase B precursor [Roseivivax sp. THAF40]|uniref:lytic murein transglycosylase n=1 Tax=unclassified Roseivivax TaxID=2639302 RepID=UPI0012691041|nr:MULTISPECIES: lytic murein transglycosylase [unclassified Roseivivax]QFS82496.1 Membrane-bound lytic murein transglycosylase B precursor [Roseivivax sp. THAF197b]QFT46265.1 Membrane-bound lytic murein transglycosylase B precursor [Roseivivax sp. THAF40]